MNLGMVELFISNYEFEYNEIHYQENLFDDFKTKSNLKQ